jgi:hypothetical protein
MSRVGRYSRKRSTAGRNPSPTGFSPSPTTRSSGVRLSCGSPARNLLLPPNVPSNPRTTAPAGSCAALVWALPRSLAATGGILSLPRGTEMFQFPRCPSHCWDDGVSPPPGCPIRRSRDRRRPAPPPGISSRGHVLPRQPAPRHPPCAHHSGSRLRAPPCLVPPREAGPLPGGLCMAPRRTTVVRQGAACAWVGPHAS